MCFFLKGTPFLHKWRFPETGVYPPSHPKLDLFWNTPNGFVSKWWTPPKPITGTCRIQGQGPGCCCGRSFSWALHTCCRFRCLSRKQRELGKVWHGEWRQILAVVRWEHLVAQRIGWREILKGKLWLLVVQGFLSNCSLFILIYPNRDSRHRYLTKVDIFRYF